MSYHVSLNQLRKILVKIAIDVRLKENKLNCKSMYDFDKNKQRLSFVFGQIRVVYTALYLYFVRYVKYF